MTTIKRLRSRCSCGAGRSRMTTGGGSGATSPRSSPRPGRSGDARRRYESYVAEIFTELGLDLHTPATENTPRRFLSAMIDATAGYNGDPKLLKVFEKEYHGGPDCRLSQIIEKPIPFYALCEHH